jgi:hypothetical protein
MKSYRACAFALLVVAAFAVGFALPRTVMAAPPVPVSGRVPAPTAGMDVVDATQMQVVSDITRRITPYLYVDERGVVRLRDVTAAQLGVSEQFLADYRAAMVNSNALIERGEMRVSPDLKVTFPAAPAVRPIAPSAPGNAALDSVAGASVTDGGPSEAVPQWGAWDYGQGGMFYNSYNDWTYYRYNYYGLVNGMAAWLHMPWLSPPLMYFYGYNQYYFTIYTYPGYGTYFYVPYSYCHQQLGYKPAYFWGQQYGWYSGCGCYRYNWVWIGFWGRY